MKIVHNKNSMLTGGEEPEIASPEKSQIATHNVDAMSQWASLIPKDITEFICPVCDKVLQHRSSLLKHMRIHTGEKFTCPKCENEFSRKDNLKKHMRICVGEDFEEKLTKPPVVAPSPGVLPVAAPGKDTLHIFI